MTTACLLTARVVSYNVRIHGLRLAPGCFAPDVLAGMLVPFTRGHDGDPIGWAVEFRDHPGYLEADLWVPDISAVDRWIAVSIAFTVLDQAGPMTTRAAVRDVALLPKGADPSARILDVKPTEMRVDVPLAQTPTRRPGYEPPSVAVVRPSFLDDDDEIADYWVAHAERERACA